MAGEHGAPRGDDGQRTISGNLARDLERGCLQSRLRHQFGHQPVVQGEAGIEGVAGQDHPHGYTHPRHLCQPLGATTAGKNPQPDLRQSESRFGRGEADVAGQRQFQPAGHTDAVDSGDGRLGHVAGAGQAAKADDRRGRVALGEIAPIGEIVANIGPGAEGAAAPGGEHGDL
ncbi:hypothetical protein D3C85_1456100 [compost metagenome]